MGQKAYTPLADMVRGDAPIKLVKQIEYIETFGCYDEDSKGYWDCIMMVLDYMSVLEQRIKANVDKFLSNKS